MWVYDPAKFDSMKREAFSICEQIEELAETAEDVWRADGGDPLGGSYPGSLFREVVQEARDYARELEKFATLADPNAFLDKFNTRLTHLHGLMRMARRETVANDND